MATAPTITAIGRPKELVVLPAVGDVVGRYTVQDKLGAGAMGAVFLASDPELDRRIALKLLVSRGAHDFRLLDEARALARLQHPNVVAIHDVGRWEGQIYIAMEYVAGVSLDAWLPRHADWRDRLAAFQQAALGLAAAHRAGIVHHDVKPSNIMAGDDGRVRLVDFGLARSNAPDVATGSAAGTPRYMSPEQRRGDVADARTDQFSLCVALYEALFGGHPFEGDTPEERGQAVLDGRVRIPPPGPIPIKTRDAILRGLACEPAQRHPTMEAFLAALVPVNRSRRALWIGATAAIAIAAGVGAAFAFRSHPAGTPPGKWDAILAASSLPPEQLAPLPNDPLGVTVHRLSNGLMVYISPNHDVPRVRALLRFRSGNATAPGLVSLAMAMSNSGTEKIGTIDYTAEKPILDRIEGLYAKRAAAKDPAQRATVDKELDDQITLASRYEVPNEHARVLRDIGMAVNVNNTFRDVTRFDMDIPSNRFEVWSELEADRFAHPVFRNFRGRVAEALQWDSIGKNDYFDRVLESVLPKLYPGHPYGYGADVVSKVTMSEPLADVERVYRSTFVPNNADLILAGDIDPVTAVPILEHTFGGWEPKPVTPLAPLPTTVASETIEVPTSGNREVSYHWIVPPTILGDPALDAMDMLFNHMLGAKHVTSSATFYLTAYGASLSPAPNESLDDAAHAIDEAIEGLRTGTGFSDEMLAGAKRTLLIYHEKAARDNATRVARMASRPPSHQWRDEVNRDLGDAVVTRADVMRIANVLFASPHLVVHSTPGNDAKPKLVIPKLPKLEYPDKRSAAAAALVDREVVQVQPKFLLAGTDFVERNRIIVKRDPKATLFTLTYQWQIGNGELPWLCETIGARIEGEIKARQYAGGFQSRIVCGARGVALGITGLDNDLPAALDVMAGWLGDPTPAEWVKMVGKHDEYVAALLGHSDWIEGAMAQLAMFGPGALGRLDIAALRATTPADGARVMTALRATPRWVGYYGPRSLDDIAKLVPPIARGTPTAPTAAKLLGGPPRVLILDGHGMSDTTNVSLLYGLDGMFGDDAEARLAILNQYWIPELHPATDKLRGTTSFDARVGWPTASRDPGWVGFRMRTTPAGAPTVITGALAEIFETKLDPAIFDRAKQQLDERIRGDWISRAEVPASTLNFHTRGAIDDSRRKFYANVGKVTLADLEAMTREVGKAPRVIAIWGNVAGLDRKALATFGEVTELSSVQELIALHAKATAAAPKPQKPARGGQHVRHRARGH